MAEQPLAGARVAVLVESQFIPAELRIYRERFEQYGATVDLVSRLWGKPSLRFYSTVEPNGDGAVPPLEWVEVALDVDRVDPNDYDAVIATANYTSVRLRYVDPPADGADPMQQARSAPAVRFFRRAMANPRIAKAAPCHALWLLTPSPEVLAGRRVTCNPVVLADVVNAGCSYVALPHDTPQREQVIVDGDLVTSTSWHATEHVVDAVRDIILARRSAAPTVAAARSEVGVGDITGSGGHRRRVLVVLSQWGYWGEELVGPLSVFDTVGYDVDFCTPTGKRPNAIPVSMDPDFYDPPLRRPVTSPAMADRVRQVDDPGSSAGARLESSINLSAWFPERPYFSAPNFVRLLEVYNRDLERVEREVTARYDALLLVGGSGPIVDLVNNQRVHDLILAFYRAGKPIAAECYGVACLAFARDLNERRSILAGKHVTGHCLEYDYKDGTAFVEERGRFLNFNMGPPPYPLEYILRDATAPGGGFHGNFGHVTSVIVDYPFITGRSTPDSVLTGEKLVEVLDGGLRRWGW
jgi:putative intracellular protease/amidase